MVLAKKLGYTTVELKIKDELQKSDFDADDEIRYLISALNG